HQNFANFAFEKTAAEVYEEYKQASKFVEYVRDRAMRHRSSGRACCLTPWREDLRPLPADGALPLRMRAERAFLPGKQREASHGAPRSFARQRAPGSG